MQPSQNSSGNDRHSDPGAVSDRDDTISGAHHDAAFWRRRAEDLSAANEAAARELASLSDEVLAASREIVQLSAQVETARREADALGAEAAVRRAEAAWHKARLADIVNSTTWRLMGPLRFFMRLLSGRWKEAGASAKGGLRQAYRSLPVPIRERVDSRRRRLTMRLRYLTESRGNLAALQAIVDRRCAFTRDLTTDPLTSAPPAELPFIDVSVVTYDSARWIEGFWQSLIAQDYPLDRLHLRFVDHGSRDETVARLEEGLAAHGRRFASAELLRRPNRGFGAGHNAGIRAGSSPYCLVTNADLTFERDALVRVASIAVADEDAAACWELRQKPFEHPKYYDPVTGETNWCSHACILLRRTAFDAVGGYDENIFMYGEDVEISYRLRAQGYHLRYCPSAVVWHFTYEHESQVKPLQYSGSIFASFYIRLKYGGRPEIAAIPLLLARLMAGAEPYPGARRDVRRKLLPLAARFPRVLRARMSERAMFPFSGLDYDIVREGAFVEARPVTGPQPLVTIVTRTYKGRELYLAQAMLSVAHQTYGKIEHVIVEDGGETQAGTVRRVQAVTGVETHYHPLEKIGRSRAGNAGVEAAKGEFVIFLDDDDLLFADHVELLVQAIEASPESVAAYSLAWEVPTDAGELSQGRYQERLPLVIPLTRQPFDREVLRRYNYIPIQAIMFRRDLYLERGGLDPNLDVLEDWNLWNRYAHGNHFTYVPKVTSLFRTPASSSVGEDRQKAFNLGYEDAVARTMVAVRRLEAADHRQSTADA